MGKDPALLLYTKDYYEGTRMMTPVERAVYMDLLIYQHNSGSIPNDPARLSLYCTGVSAEIVESVLKQKFVLEGDQWRNLRLAKEMARRSGGAKDPRLQAAAAFGNFFRKHEFSESEALEMRQAFKRANLDGFDDLDAVEAWFYDTLKAIKGEQKGEKKARVKARLLENANETENTNENYNMAAQFFLNHDFSNEFKEAWNAWVEYCKDQHEFEYKSYHTMEKALMDLLKMAGNSETIAIELINKSMSRGWKGFYEKKENERKSASGNLAKVGRSRDIVNKLLKDESIS